MPEKLARLKFNGQLRGYSPLSRIVELRCSVSACTANSRCGRMLRELILAGLHLTARAARGPDRPRRTAARGIGVPSPRGGRTGLLVKSRAMPRVGSRS